ncbi:hypothetical protein AVEN_176761-1 [Araneus ventricosus]|uniref:Uncharacterized protein n=1 Tax=Araneus ventricosus TaxID=182803 RepID=A0A4Y2QBQ9_ARAVE|nr:hypothetical protein AVEN_70662-1 [Araneus ventricosus]GBN60483.1 hypothetical protein AVEN_176761-1 [Araneus ventricosus]
MFVCTVTSKSVIFYVILNKGDVFIPIQPFSGRNGYRHRDGVLVLVDRTPAELIHRGSTVYHPSNWSPRTANTWGFWLYMRSRKQTQRQQLLMESSLACRRGMEWISKKEKV